MPELQEPYYSPTEVMIRYKIKIMVSNYFHLSWVHIHCFESFIIISSIILFILIVMFFFIFVMIVRFFYFNGIKIYHQGLNYSRFSLNILELFRYIKFQ